MGPAPKWCSFLDSLVEELEEDKEVTVYDDYKFVTAKDLEALGLTHLLGTDLLRAYMHGYFMDIKLYHKVKAVVEPFAYEEYRKNKIRQKIDEQRATRIRQKVSEIFLPCRTALEVRICNRHVSETTKGKQATC